MSFECDQCGSCCRSLKRNALYADLDVGNGVCVFLNETGLCSIYYSRPLKCRIDDCYDEFFSDVMSRDVFYSINKEACTCLKRGGLKRKAER
ncbi:MAG: YkgJ family cysteine cluster protein [Synergistaceae bacterium]|jgi:Fe-S-cluster containining protein|nr:YkgJ family cysteine cluster protein [Synergistaceae bacterium]